MASPVEIAPLALADAEEVFKQGAIGVILFLDVRVSKKLQALFQSGIRIYIFHGGESISGKKRCRVPDVGDGDDFFA